MRQRKTSYPQKVLIDRIQCVYNIASVSLPYTLPCLEDPAKEEAGRMEELEDREKGSQTPPSKQRTVMVTMNSQQLCLPALGSHNSCPLNNQLQRRKVLTGGALLLTVALLATDSRGEEDKYPVVYPRVSPLGSNVFVPSSKSHKQPSLRHSMRH